MSDQPLSPDEMKARGFGRLAIVFLVLTLLVGAGALVEYLDTPRIYSATDIEADDFTTGTNQAILTGTMQVRETRLDLADATEMSLQLTGGSSMTVLTPFTADEWTNGDDVDVMIVSPTISGVTRDTAQMAAQGYMDELTSKPDNILVTLLPDEMRTILAQDHSEIEGVSNATLFVWPDHVNSTNFGPTKDPFTFFTPVLPFLFALGFWIASRVFKRRAAQA